MRLAFVVQRYGLDIAGGAEYHCRLVAERLSRRAQVQVFTTCATDYITWANELPDGDLVLNGVPVRRFRVKRPRDPARFARESARVAREHTEKDELRWLEEQGPYSPRLVREIERRRADFDFWISSYRYYTTYHGLRAAGDRAILVPTAEDDGLYRLSIFPPLFRLPRAIVWNSVEERAMIERAAGGHLAPGDVIGVGSALPERLDPEAFRRRYGVEGPFALYVGRIDQNKGCPELFAHFLRYRRETGSKLRLVLVGKAVLALPDDPGIVHLGFLPDEDKWNALAACDFLMMPSRLESLSMVTLEAWWAERPVLANARCEVLRGQCQRSNAGLYYASYEEFKETVALLQSRPDIGRALGRSGHAYFEANYSWEVIERKYFDLLGGACDPAREQG